MTKYPQLELDDKDYQVPELDSELSREQEKALNELSDLDRAKLFFQLPLPSFEHTARRHFYRHSDLPENFGLVKYKTSSGVNFSISRQYYQSSPKYSCILKQTSSFTEEEFERQFITGFLDNIEKEYEENTSLTFHSVSQKIYSWRDVQKLLMQYLFLGIKKSLTFALEKDKDIFLNDYPEFLVPKGKESIVKALAVLDLEGNLYEGDNRSTLFLGVFSFPNLCVGHSFSLSKRLEPVISLSVIGEVQTPALKIKEVYDCISQNPEDLNLVLEAGELVEAHEKFQKALQVLLTKAIKLGCQKLILTNGYYFLLIYIDSDFIDEDSSGTLLKFKKSKHCLLSAQDPYIKLKIASFMYFNRTLGEEQKKLRTRINDELKDGVSKYLKGNQMTPSTTSNEEIQRKRTRTPESETDVEVELQTPLHKSSHIFSQEEKEDHLGKFYDDSISKSLDKFDEYTLANFYELEFRKMVKAYVQFRFRHQSLVFLVDALKFSQEVPLRLGPQPPVDVMVKVYDVFWKINEEMEKSYFVSEYQRSARRAEQEINSYIKLKSLQGRLIPKLFGYGTLDDIEPSAGKIHIRPFGPFICVESFEKDDDFTMTRLFLEDEVIPAFQELHKLNVVHNNVNVRNIIVTKDKDVKIIDFADTVFTTHTWQFNREIENLYQTFKIPLHQ